MSEYYALGKRVIVHCSAIRKIAKMNCRRQTAMPPKRPYFITVSHNTHCYKIVKKKKEVNWVSGFLSLFSSMKDFFFPFLFFFVFLKRSTVEKGKKSDAYGTTDNPLLSKVKIVILSIFQSVLQIQSF